MSTNPIRDLLKEFVDELSSNHSFTQIAEKLSMSREGLRLALREDKQVESFKVGTLLTITETFPITIRISQGRCEAFRWDKISTRYRQKAPKKKKKR